MSGAKPRRKSASHARRTGRPLRRTLRPRLSGGGRILAVLLFTAAVAGLVAVVYGPWLRVTALGHTGVAYTPAGRVEEILDDYRGMPILAVDRSGLRDRLAALPTVADARVELRLPGDLQVAITEKAPAFVWRTQRAVLVGSRDGTIVAELPLTAQLSGGLRRLPNVEDNRLTSRLLAVGDTVPPSELRVAERLTALDPRLIGSRATTLEVKVNYQKGFVLESTQPAWTAALGFYQLDPREDQAAADARLEQQLAAIRTLFASRAERNVSWLDASNPGKVYWTP